MKKTNVLVIADYAAPYKGSFMSSMLTLREVRDSLEKGPTFFCLPEEAKKKDWVNEFGKVVYFKRHILQDAMTISRFVREKKIEVIYAHFCEKELMLMLKLVKMMNPRVKIVEHLRNHFDAAKNPIKRILKRMIYSADLYIGCSKSVAEKLPFKKTKCRYATNAIYLPRLDEYEKVELAGKGDFVVLMFGRPYYRKGVDLAIKAIQELENPKIKLVISLSVLRKEFEAEIRKDFGEIPEFVKIVPPRNDIGSYYHAANLFISPAREEGFCNAIPESMYCGIPCISSDIDGIPREIPDLILFKSKDFKQLSRDIKLVYDKKNKFDAKKVKKYVEDNFSVTEWAKKISKMLESV